MPFRSRKSSSESKDELADRLPLATASLLLKHCHDLQGTSEFLAQ